MPLLTLYMMRSFRAFYCLFFIGIICLSACKPKKAGEGVFELLPAGKTGVGFVNRNIVTDSVNILDYLYISTTVLV